LTSASSAGERPSLSIVWRNRQIERGLARRGGEVETESMTVMWFTNHEAIARFAGPDWETAVVPASARAVLSGFEEKAAHYESRVAPEAVPHV
jgi:hypothetical protein